MSFLSNDQRNAQPVSCYTFSRGDKLWRYTDQPADVTVGGVTYRAASITHGEFQKDDESAAGETTVTCAGATPIVSELDDIGPNGLPLICTIRQTHRSGVGGVTVPATAVRFKGHVVSRTIDAGTCAFTVASVASLFERPLLRVVCTPTCNHTVYAPGCGVDSAAFTVTGCAISAISGLTLTVADAALQADDWYAAGFLVVESGTAAGERAFIAAHAGDQLTLLTGYPPGLTTADTIAITAGCDGRETTCRTKFDNVPFFLGFPRVPQVNPFERAV